MIDRYTMEIQTVRLRESVTHPQIDRRAYLNLPQEPYKEDVEMIKRTLDALYIESRPEHTPEHSVPCPACIAKVRRPWDGKRSRINTFSGRPLSR